MAVKARRVNHISPVRLQLTYKTRRVTHISPVRLQLTYITIQQAFLAPVFSGQHYQANYSQGHRLFWLVFNIQGALHLDLHNNFVLKSAHQPDLEIRNFPNNRLETYQ